MPGSPRATSRATKLRPRRCAPLAAAASSGRPPPAVAGTDPSCTACSITEAIDTTTPAGRMMMQMIGAFAEFERAMIRERTSTGLATARAEGRIGGRRKKLDSAKRREIAESVISGRKTGAEMARLYNVSAPTVSRIVAAHRTGLVEQLESGSAHRHRQN
jgi:DNA invertase Pin-like site-specific DNA recombinase